MGLYFRHTHLSGLSDGVYDSFCFKVRVEKKIEEDNPCWGALKRFSQNEKCDLFKDTLLKIKDRLCKDQIEKLFFEIFGQDKDGCKEGWDQFCKTSGISDRKLKVSLSDNEVTFFYKDDDTDNLVNVHRHVPLFVLPLGTTERIDEFLLHAGSFQPEMTDGKESACVITSDNESRLQYSTVLKDQSILEVPDSFRQVSIFEMLLCFFDDLKHKGSDFHLYDKVYAGDVLRKLEESQVFRLIWKKFSFYKSLDLWLKSGRSSKGDLNELSSAYTDFVDALIKEDVTREIPVRLLKKGQWFEDPESEMDHIVSISKDMNLDFDRDFDIRAWYMKKHAVLNALRLDSHFKYLVSVIGNCISCALFLITFFLWECNVFESTGPILLSAVAVFVITFVLQGVHRPNIAVYMPRIVVAIATGWFMLISAEDFVKNLFDIDKDFSFTGALLLILLVTAFVYSESRQHSPYYRMAKFNRMRDFKILPILVYSFNVAAVFGVIFQMFIIDKQLDRSGILQSSAFESQMHNVRRLEGKYKIYLSRVENAKDVLSSTYLAMHDDNISAFTELVLKDYTQSNEDTIVRSHGRLLSSNSSAIPKYIDDCNKRIEELKNIDPALKNDLQNREILQEIESLEIIDIDNKGYKNVSVAAVRNNYYGIETIGNMCNNAISELDSLASLDGGQLRKFITYPFDTVNGDKTVNSDRIVQKTEECDATSNNKKDILFTYGYKYGFCFDTAAVHAFKPFFNTKYDYCELEEYRVFPYMLIFQIFVVMALAIVTQLIISDKSVTEPL